VDASLRETAPGVYETAVTLRRPGAYELAFFLDSPRLVHCFPLTVAENRELAGERAARAPLRVEYRFGEPRVAVGREVEVRFRLRDPRTAELRADLDDVRALTFLAPGHRQRRRPAEPDGDGGYRVRFTPEEPGAYYVFVEAPSAGLEFREAPPLILEAR
jgi:hypothetical protein